MKGKSFMQRSHQHIKVCHVGVAKTILMQVELDMYISWQLRGLCGCYVICVAIMGLCSTLFLADCLVWPFMGQIYIKV